MLYFSRRGALALLAGLAAGGCRFEPALRRGQSAAILTGQFSVSVPGDRIAFLLEESLLQRLGNSGGIPSYMMQVSLEVSEGKGAATGSGGVDRLLLSGAAEFTVIDADDVRLADGAVKGLVTFSSIDEIIASDAARKDAEQRLADLLAEKIVARLLLNSDEWAL